jgi:hypothetical protein
MSRGPGSCQRAILDAIAKCDKLVPLGGRTRGERAALVRAAAALNRAGQCVVVRLWNDQHTALNVLVGRPDLTLNGRPAKELSIARVPHGTGATLAGSIRHIAREFGVSRTTTWRDLQQANRMGKIQ